MALAELARPRLFAGPGRGVDWWAVLALPVGAPLAYLAWLAARAAPLELVQALGRANVPELVAGAASVAVGATVWAWVLAVPWAWLVARTDVPGRDLFRGLGPLPLAVPPYVGALVYVVLLAPGGALHQALAAWRGLPVALTPFPSLIYGPGGAAFVLGTFTAPHLFLAVHAALQRTSTSLEEAARSLGLSQREVLLRVTLPLLRPSLLAGSLAIFMYAWVDFGVVSLLRVRTFTTAVYNYLLAGFSMSAAAALSLVLVALVGGLLVAQRRALGAARYTQVAGRSQSDVARLRLGRWRWVGFAYLCLAAALALGIPLGGLVWQAARLGSAGLLAFLGQQLGFLANTLVVALGGATVAVGFAAIFAWLRWSSGRGWLGLAVLQAGYAVPGTVLGLSLVGLTLALLPALYGTPPVLVGAYVVLFAGPTAQVLAATLAQVPRSLEEAARALGRSPVIAAVRVVAPLTLPGLVSAWLLAFVLSMRELAATIILRPAGSDTLAVRIWVYTMDVGPDPRAAATALLLTTVTGSLWLALLALNRSPQGEVVG